MHRLKHVLVVFVYTHKVLGQVPPSNQHLNVARQCYTNTHNRLACLVSLTLMNIESMNYKYVTFVRISETDFIIYGIS